MSGSGAGIGMGTMLEPVAIRGGLPAAPAGSFGAVPGTATITAASQHIVATTTRTTGTATSVSVFSGQTDLWSVW